MQPGTVPTNSVANSPRDPSALPSHEAEQLRLLVENARDFAMFLLEPDGTTLSWNPGVQNLLGYEEHEWIGTDCEVIFTPEDRERGDHLKERQTAVTTGRAEDERWHVRKDGSRFFASGVMSAVYDQAGKLVSLGKVLRDHTEKKQMEEALHAFRNEVVDVNAALVESAVTLEARVTERTAALSALAGRLVTAQEKERRRISRELHDSTGQHLTAISLELAALDAALTAESRAAIDEALPRAGRLRSLLRELSHEVHCIAVDLRPTSLDDLGLVSALETYLEEWSERAGVAVAFEASDLDGSANSNKRLPPVVETTIYRIVQEALTNAAKYACGQAAEAAGRKATQVSVTLQRRDNFLQATVEDDGPGFDVDSVGTERLGLMGMRERATLLGGTLEIESAPGSGTAVYARIPLPSPV